MKTCVDAAVGYAAILVSQNAVRCHLVSSVAACSTAERS
jgi:hypothetical protein